MNNELTLYEITQRLRVWLYEKQLPIAQLAKHSMLDAATIQGVLRGACSERTRKRLSSTFVYIESLPPKKTAPTTKDTRRKSSLYRLIRLCIKHGIGEYGLPLIDEYKDPLLIALKTAYKSPSDVLWHSVNQKVIVALLVRYASNAKREGVNLNTNSALVLFQRLQASIVLI